MILSIYVSTIVLLGLITWQDFKYRAVYWFIFPLLMFVLLIKFALNSPFQTFHHLLTNLFVLLIQLVLLSIWMYFRGKTSGTLKKCYIGLGDVLFFIILAMNFAPIAFIAFQLLSLSLTLITVLLLKATGRRVDQIPLAGCQSLLLIPVMGFEYHVYPSIPEYERIIEDLLK